MAVLCGVFVTGVMVSSVLAQTYVPFSNSTSVNLLERWQPDGKNLVYYYNETSDVGKLSQAMLYKRHVGGMYSATLHTAPSTVVAHVDIGTDGVQLDKITLEWRQDNHTPTWWEIWDNNGMIGSGKCDADHPFTLDTLEYSISKLELSPGVPWPTSTYLEIRTSNASYAATGNPCLDILHFGAYAAKGIELTMDGTFNIFQEERTKLGTGFSVEAQRFDRTDGRTPTGTFDAGWLTNGGRDCVGLGMAGEIIWTFSREYTLSGAYLTKEGGGDIVGLTFEVFDGTKWVEVFASNVSASGYVYFRDMVTGDPIEITGGKLRMSWDDSGEPSGTTGWNGGGGRELSEILLFGYALAPIPEPATMSLLVLGGLALLRRRA